MRFWFLYFICAAAALAQSFQGSLRGRVVDPNGAVVALVKITVVDEGTASQRSIHSFKALRSRGAGGKP